MKRTTAALLLAALALLSACGSDPSGDSNTDSQTSQPPVPESS